MNYYKIINNEQALINFIDWLPDLRENEKFLLCLFSRKKYCQDIVKSSDKTQLKRTVVTKENMLHKVKQMETRVGTYKLKNGVDVPQESLVLYITVNPRSMMKATRDMGKRCWDLVMNQNFNIQAEALSCIQRAKSRSVYVDFDFDTKDVDFSYLDEIIPNSFDIVETRGGYHVLVSTEKIKGNKKWYNQITDYYGDLVDQTGDQLLPVPGACQGGFTPKLFKNGKL